MEYSKDMVSFITMMAAFIKEIGKIDAALPVGQFRTVAVMLFVSSRKRPELGLDKPASE